MGDNLQSLAGETYLSRVNVKLESKITSLGRSCVHATFLRFNCKVVGLPARLLSAFPVVYCDMAIIYSGDLPNDWCLVPVEKIDGYKGTDFQVGCMVLHLLDSSIFYPYEVAQL